MRGGDSGKVRIVDRVSKAYSSKKMASFDYIDILGNFTLQGKKGGSLNLYHNIEE